MPINQSPVDALNPSATARPAPSGSSDRGAPLRRLADGTAALQAAIGIPGLAALAGGSAFAAIGTAWAISVDVPAPLALMIGFCTLAASAGLSAAVMVIANAVTHTPPVPSGRRLPNYAAWKLLSTLSVSDAAHLWCDLEPGSRATEECIAWASAMLDAVKRGELATCERPDRADGRERNSPTWQTVIARDALKAWALSHGHLPRFLDD
ncbi:MAG: hypothetical protein IT536_11915 [Hyphomicrobiales bacterium]|nr:hypothetical protein [Hyphomicrobiales bacterium]